MTIARSLPRVDLHIERLVLDGIRFNASEGERFRAGVEAELTRLLAERGLRPDALARDARPTAPVDLRGVPVGDSATRVAEQLLAQLCDQVHANGRVALAEGTVQP